jgi:hypothetical protein
MGAIKGKGMSYNLFIAYDLISIGQNYDAVRNAIKSLGQWHQFQYSLFYVSTKYSPSEAYNIVLAAMDSNDKLAVIDARGGIVTDWDRPPIAEINAIWFNP